MKNNINAKSKNLGLIAICKSRIRIPVELPPYPFSLYCLIHPLSKLNSNSKFLPLQNPCIIVVEASYCGTPDRVLLNRIHAPQCGIRVGLCQRHFPNKMQTVHTDNMRNHQIIKLKSSRYTGYIAPHCPSLHASTESMYASLHISGAN